MNAAQSINNSKCTFPLCHRKADREGLCFLHLKHFGGPKPVEKPKAISIKSVKRIVDEKLYKKIVKGMMAESDKCELNAPGCTIIATGLHHQKKRAGNLYLDKRYLKRACNNCNNWCEKNPLEAIKNGYSISKFKKEAI